MSGKISGLFDIFSLVIFPILMVVGEFALMFFATFAEICAEMISDTIFPRYREIPPALLKKHEPAPVPAQAAAAPQAAEASRSAYVPKNPRYAGTLQAEKRKEPFKPGTVDPLSKLDKLLPAESRLTKAIVPGVVSYRDAMKARGAEVPVGELRLLWLVLTHMIAKDNAASLKNPALFVDNAIRAIQNEMPEIVENWPPHAMAEQYDRLEKDVAEGKEKLNPDYDETTKEIISTLGSFMAVANRPDDTEAADLLEKAVIASLEKAKSLL